MIRTGLFATLGFMPHPMDEQYRDVAAPVPADEQLRLDRMALAAANRKRRRSIAVFLAVGFAVTVILWTAVSPSAAVFVAVVLIASIPLGSRSSLSGWQGDASMMATLQQMDNAQGGFDAGGAHHGGSDGGGSHHGG